MAKYKVHWWNMLLCWHSFLAYKAVNAVDEGEEYAFCPKCKRKLMSVVKD